MAYKLQLKRGLTSALPTGSAGEPLFTTDTNDLYIGTGAANQRYQKYIASGTSSQFLKGDGSLDSNTYYLASNPSAFIALTALTASSPLSYNNTTGAFTIAQASGTTNGFLSSTDWTTFNNKQNALTNPVTGTGTSGQVAYFNGTTTITGESNLFWDATNDRLGIGITTPGAKLEILGTSSDQLRLSTAATEHYRIGRNASTGYLDFYGSQTGYSGYTFGGVDGERMRIIANGNVGISTTSPAYKLQVNNSTADTHIAAVGTSPSLQVMDLATSPNYWATIGMATSNDDFFNNTIAGDLVIANRGAVAGNIRFGLGGTNRMTLTSSGNLGLGVTPSAWGLGKAIEIGNIGNSIWGVNSTQFNVLQNAYHDSGYKYASTNAASYYQQAYGAHAWYNAPSGTAGNAITFTQAMTLNASGNLSIGNTNNTYKLDVTGTGRFGGTNTYNGFLIGSHSNNVGAAIYNKGNAAQTLYADNSSTVLNAEVNLYLRTGNTDRLTIASTGAATFSSSVTAGARIQASGSNGAGFGQGGYLINYSADTASRTWLINNDNQLYGDFVIAQSTTQTGSTYVNRLYISPSGSIGIGTSSPAAIIDILGGPQAAIIRSSNATTLYTSFLVNTSTAVGYIGNGNGIVSGGGVNTFGVRSESDLIFASGGNSERLRIASTGAATFSSSVEIGQSATVRGFAGTTGAGMFMAYGSAGAGIGSIYSYNYGTSTYGGTVIDGSYVAFYNSGSEKMRVTSGNVGIGTTSPANKLDVLGTAASPNLTGSNAYAKFYQSGGYANITIGGLASGSFAGWLQSSDGVGTVLPLAINPSGGNVGIGTTSPTEKLHVAGNIKTTSTGWTAGAWKLGTAASGTPSTNHYITVEIDGQIYSIPALQGTP